VLIGAVIFLAQTRFAGPIARIGEARLQANAEAVKSLSGMLAGALAIRVFNRQRKAHAVFEVENGKIKVLDFKRAMIGMWQDLFTSFQGWLTLIMVFGLGGWFVAAGTMDFPSLMMIQPLAMAIGFSMSDIGATYAGLKTPIVAAKRVIDRLDEGYAAAVPSKTPDWDGRYGISISGLNFQYKDAAAPALSGVELEIGENEMVAFVGESGGGKSTLLKVVMGLYSRGELPVKLGNMHFAAGHLLSWREKFAYVDQSARLFDMSVADNISMGLGGKKDMAAVKEAAGRANAAGFIEGLQGGYDADCGERGASLSGGQKQRIAIARALYRKAPVLVFDEITSALDAESENQVLAAIEALRADHTILMTTHNLANIVNADKIAVINGGRVVEVGTHEGLMERQGEYFRLFMTEGNAAAAG
jgi:ABC-type multidrug transport system fused ATPase/permease subunit